MTRIVSVSGVIVISGLLFGEVATRDSDITRNIILHSLLSLTLGFSFLFYCGFATLHAVQHVTDPVERALWVLMTVGANIVGSCIYYCTKYSSFRRVGKGGLIRKTGQKRQKLSDLLEEETKSNAEEAGNPPPGKMSATFQILTLGTTFVLVLLAGVIFDTGYFQAAILAKEVSGGKPMPGITSILSENHRALPYVLLMPWMAFATIPFLTRAETRYFDDSLFLIRFAAVAAIESLLCLVLLFFLLLPFIPYYPVLDTRPDTTAETLVVTGFWILVATILFRGAHQCMKRRNADA